MILHSTIYSAMAASGLVSAVLCLVLWYLSTVTSEPDVTRWWAAGFLFDTLHNAVGLYPPWMGAELGQMATDATQGIAAILLLAGALRLAGKGGRQGWTLVATPIVLAWSALFTQAAPHPLLEMVPLYVLSGLALLYAGVLFLRERHHYTRSGYLLVGSAFILWGLHKLDYPLLEPEHRLHGMGYLASRLLGSIAAVGLIVAVQRRQHYEAEQATLRAQASERELQSSEAHYRDLVENSVLGVMISRGNHLLHANPAAAHIFGYNTPAELTAVTLDALADPSEVARLRAFLLARRAGESAPQHYEFKGQHRDGLPLWVDCTIRVIQWDGRTASQATISDITEKRRMEEMLRAQQQLLHTVLDSVPHVIVVHDREGRMLLANRAWSLAFGRDPESYLGQTAEESGLHSPEVAERMQRISRSVVEAEQPISHEQVLSVLQGQRRFQTTRTPLRGEDGRVVGVVTISEDITEQRAMEEQLRQAQKMEAVGQLTGGVAHDFNNLLSVIMGNLELLQAQVGDDPQAITYAGRALKATERGAALTQRLLAFSRRQSLQPRPLDLCRQIESQLDLLRSSVGEAIRLETSFSAEPCEVRTDPNQLENALLNLALNARDAMPNGGTLHIDVHPVGADALPRGALSAHPLSDWVLVAVSDSGTGMPESVQARAVEPFFTTKGPGSGSGLGLSMVYGFMEQTGGQMHIESAEGQGTSVKLFFPRRGRESEAATARARPVAAPLEAGPLVLVVEDDPSLGHLVVEMLSELNCPAIRALDARDALQTLRENRQVGLLFTDVILPNGMDGVSLAREARALRPELKVLFTSGYAETVFERYPTDLTGAELVQKPYRLSDLASKLSRVLGRDVSMPE